jgi:hypothetical protein
MQAFLYLKREAAVASFKVIGVVNGFGAIIGDADCGNKLLSMQVQAGNRNNTMRTHVREGFNSRVVSMDPKLK